MKGNEVVYGKIWKEGREGESQTIIYFYLSVYLRYFNILKV